MEKIGPTMKSNQKNILILTAVEDAVNKAVIRSQVFRLIRQFKGESYQFFYLGLVPLRFYFRIKNPVKSFKAFQHNRRRIKTEYSAQNIKIIFLPFLFPFRRINFYMKVFYLFIFLVQTLPVLLVFIALKRIRVVQARSYPAALISTICSWLLPIKTVFEPRGFYPDEAVVYGVFREGSQDYTRWKRREKQIVDSAFRVVVESKTFKEYVQKFSPLAKLVIIPCYVDTDVFVYNPQIRKRLRKQFAMDGKFVMTYSGTIGGWHTPSVQASYFVKIKTLIPHAHYLVLTYPQFHGQIRSALLERSVTEDAFTLLSPAPDEVPHYLLMGDAGLLVIEDLPTARKAVSVKFGEYLACGLPVLCTPFVEGAAQLIREYDCGAIVNIDEDSSFQALDRFVSQHGTLQKNGLDLVRSYLSVQVNSRRFAEIYEKSF